MRNLGWKSFLVVAPVAVPVAAAHAQSIAFNEVAAQSGVIWTHTDLNLGMGAGPSFFDANGDGLSDILLVGGKSVPGLFRNVGGGGFVDATVGAGIHPPTVVQTHMGTACADVDSDSDVDVFLTGMGPNLLYRNLGNATFQNVTAASGLSGAFSTAWGTSSAFGDYDQDGDLDLFLCNYVTVPSQPTPNRMYKNTGAGVFQDVTVANAVAGNGTALACMWSDFDQDGDADLWLGNDLGMFFEPNRLYRNDGPSLVTGQWTFTDVAPALNANAALYDMGLHGGDIDRDGDFDYHFSNIGRKLMLRNDGAAGFVDVSTPTGLEGTFDPYQSIAKTASWGQGFHDFDRDGWIDLYVSHGFIPPPDADPNSVNVPNAVNHLYRNNGASGDFTNVGLTAGIEDPGVGRGAAFSDYDQDGDIDILQANMIGPARLFRNVTTTSNRWLGVNLRGRLSARDALGALLRAESNGVVWVREAQRNYGYLASHDPGVHFGLGAANEVDHLEVRWPRGIVQHRYHVASNQFVSIKEPYLTFDTTSTYAATVSEGNVLALNPVLRNHTAEAKTAYYFLEVRVGTVSVLGPILSANVAANSTLAVPFPVPVPLGITGGHTIPLEIVWNVYDVTVGHDQWRNSVLLTP